MKLTLRVLRRLMRLRRSSKGGAAVELAVVFPVILLLIIGVVDFGRMYFTSVAVANAARAGAEWGATVPANAGDTVNMRKFANLDGAEAAPFNIAARRYCKCFGAGAACNAFCSGGSVPDVYWEVKATKSLATLLRYPGLPSTISIVRTATFRSQ